MAKLILIRHGETDKNLQGKMHEAGDEEALNSTGIKQIELAAKALEKYSPQAVYTSKEKRAKASAFIIAKHFDLPVNEIEGMRERNWGVYCGKSWEELGPILEKMSLEERYNFVPPEGESWQAFEQRLTAAIKNILAENADRTVVIVSHMGAIRVLMPFLLGAPKEESFKYEPENASISIFDHENGRFTLETVNDTKHLVF
jgi:broad specificity phosphatase PhoE